MVLSPPLSVKMYVVSRIWRIIVEHVISVSLGAINKTLKPVSIVPSPLLSTLKPVVTILVILTTITIRLRCLPILLLLLSTILSVFLIVSGVYLRMPPLLKKLKTLRLVLLFRLLLSIWLQHILSAEKCKLVKSVGMRKFLCHIPCRSPIPFLQKSVCYLNQTL